MSDKRARDVMSTDCTCVGENETLIDAARKLADKDVGALPICGEDDRLKGMLTDRDGHGPLLGGCLSVSAVDRVGPRYVR
jgi:CBS-domain-containing membrane protein